MPLARAGNRALVALASGGAWRLPVNFGWAALLFTLAVAGAAICLFGLAPALAATRLDVNAALQAARPAASGGSRTRMAQSLVVAQIAIALVMLSGASLFARSLWNLRHQNFGFEAARVVAADLPLEFTAGMRRRHTALAGPLEDAAVRIPGVRSAAVSSFGLLGSMQHTVTASTPDRPMAKSDLIRRVHVSVRYFETLGIPILAGRGVTAEDREHSPPVVVLSQTAARTLFLGTDPVGHYLSDGREYNAKNVKLVIGVAQDVRFAGPRDPFGAVEYVPLAQEPAPVTAILIRPAGEPRSMTGALRAAIRAVAGDLRIGEIRPLDEILDAGLGTERTLATLSASFGLLALILTCVGVHGVIAYSVRRRTREIGVRIALGADRASVTAMLLGGVGRLLGLGLLLGGCGTFAAVGVLRGTLFGIDARDYSMPLLAALILSSVAMLSGWLPARRGARLDPMDALRHE
jgi:predicted permease